MSALFFISRLGEKMNWDCPKCSFSNHPDLIYCEICDYHSGGSVSTNTMVGGSSSSPEVLRKEDIGQGQTAQAKGNSSIVIGGILELIGDLQQSGGSKFSEKDHSEYRLCFPYCLHVSQKGTYGSAWSCGYRNIQILCSSLMRVEAYKTALFNGTGIVPEIAQLQQWIETAWQAGFDVEGAVQLEGKLVGTNKWIGTTECAALLRYFGLRAVIVDFHGDGERMQQSKDTVSGSKRPRDDVLGAGAAPAGDNMGERLCNWVHKYLNSNNRNDAASAAASAAGFVNNPAISASTYGSNNGKSNGNSGEGGVGDSGAQEAFIPPLYFQHQGHSRTIVGMQYTVSSEADGAKVKVPENLIIFNPTCDASISKQSLLQGNLRWRTQLCKNKSTFKEDNYQLVYVAPGLMSASEQQRSKLLIGTSEYSVIQTSL